MEDVNPRIPAIARMYDYWLGGKDNFAADRKAAEAVLGVAPEVAMLAKANRRFLVRAVRELVERGVDQFIDIGTGYPTSPNVHEVARGVRPTARVVYVDNDPIVVAHNRALRDIPAEVEPIAGDARTPADILTHPVVRRLIDFRRPVAVLMLAVLHFVPDERDPASIAEVLHASSAPGSYLAISHATADEADRGRADAAASVYEKSHAASPAIVRTPKEIEGLFGSWELEPPGLTRVATWPRPGPIYGVTIAGGLARRG